MARSSYVTLLSLNRYANIMGINPMHFAGATAGDSFPLHNSCADLWQQYSWQFADVVGREDLANEIKNAERDIVRELGWWPAPVWRYQEVRTYPRHYRRDAYAQFGRNIRHQRKGIKTEFAKVIGGGRRATTLVEAGATVTYSDEDGDGFAETATVTATTTVTDVFELFAFTADKEGAEQWEIRDPRSKSISGSTVTFTFWSWQMIDPEVWERFPSTVFLDGDVTIDLSGLTETPVDTMNLVGTVDIYRVYNDNITAPVLFLWEPTPKGTVIGLNWSCSTSDSCEACGFTTQSGCLGVRLPIEGVVVPTPATYDEDSAQWNQACFNECRDPDLTKLWYRCGHISNEYLAGTSYDPLSDRWAKAIAQLATARLERPLCSCGNTKALTVKWQMDAAQQTNRLMVTDEDLGNPFGTRYGEILAWRQIRRERHIIRGGGVVG